MKVTPKFFPNGTHAGFLDRVGLGYFLSVALPLSPNSLKALVLEPLRSHRTRRLKAPRCFVAESWVNIGHLAETLPGHRWSASRLEGVQLLIIASRSSCMNPDITMLRAARSSLGSMDTASRSLVLAPFMFHKVRASPPCVPLRKMNRRDLRRSRNGCEGAQ